MTVNGKAITKSEFLQIYLKNNPDPKYDQTSLDEYMELFKRFKLKVAEAEAMGYDTIPKLVKELAGYKKQLALPYMIDSAKNQDLVKEAYERTVTEIRASHILLRVDQFASPEDTLRAYNRLLELKKRIESGEDFATVAKGKGGSEDPSAASNGGDLGYFTAFQMVYPFEDMAYKTKVGQVSMPFRTRFGYHILKVSDRRPSRGTMEAAHIMIAAGKNEGEEAIKVAETKINEIHALLKKGENFEALVLKYSDDPSTNQKEGRLPIFGTGSNTRMIPQFEEVAFGLAKDGDFSEPIRTDYGFHIIKRIKQSDVPPFEAMKKELESKVAKDIRAQQTQSSFVEKLKKEYGYKYVGSKNIKYIQSLIDTSYYDGKFNASAIKQDKALFSLHGKTYGQKEFAKYLEENFRAVSRDTKINEMISQQYKNFEKETILQYEESRLAEKHPSYKALITEYHDGILLYEVMSDMVWNKAMKDTAGLQSYFDQNRNNYTWGKRIDADIFECNDKKHADQVYKLLSNDTTQISTVINTVNKESELNTRHRNGKFEIEKIKYLQQSSLKKGLNPIIDSEGKFYVLKVNEVLEPGVKEFKDAKGAVTSDYQNYLEKKWLEELEQKHKVVIHKDVLYSLGK